MESGTIVTPGNEAEWLAERLEGVGASEAAAAVGVCPYTTPVELWQRKTGRAAPVEQNDAMRWGKLLEPLIAAEYERRTGRTIERAQAFYRHPVFPFITATLDGVAEDRIVEIKTASAWSKEWGDEDSDQIPEPYLVQVHQQMCVTGARLADVAALIGGQRFRVYTVERDDALCNAIEDRVVAFWRRVQSDTPPDWGRVTAADLAAVNPGCEGSVELPEGVAVAVGAYEELGARIKDMEGLRENYKLDVLRAMGDHQIGVLPDGRRVKRFVEQVPAKSVSYEAKAYTKHYFRALKGGGR